MKSFNYYLKKDDKIKVINFIAFTFNFYVFGIYWYWVDSDICIYNFQSRLFIRKFPFLDEYNLFKDLDRNKSILITVTFIITIFIIKNAFIIL